MGAKQTDRAALASLALAGIMIMIMGLLVACGEDGEPGSGFYNPCETPAAGAVGCPTNTTTTSPSDPQSATLHDACKKLVTCGLLASEWYGDISGECSSSDTCATTPRAKETGGPGKCLPSPSDKTKTVCAYHRLDYTWCVARFSIPGASGCTTQPFVDQDITSMIGCITSTQCGTLGLSLERKRFFLDHTQLPKTEFELDEITCKNGTTTIWTATICDHGLLRYHSHTNQ